ncbi:hypothetical protein [Enterobacter asburiae]|uniref:hypothetical protein n=1 Tax=Enterobacter asburiae TaxID=61645 RepID=UPI003D6FE4DE|nr:hypothetical protein [Enterobacter asburiae]HBM7634884.1 hypothetical protein [Enterobacter asburiae]HBM7662275.1 hypothetical protein [Enterobacter asburiae]HBM7677066.1 hypothetical protein [Enterobacter asburiae]
MEVIMLGGPYNNELVDAKDPPIHLLKMPPKVELYTAVISEDASPNQEDDIFIYRLERVVTSPQQWRYEYHYQGR